MTNAAEAGAGGGLECGRRTREVGVDGAPWRARPTLAALPRCVAEEDSVSTLQTASATAGARSWWRWLAIAAVAAALLLGVFVAVLPRLVDSAAVRGELGRRMSQLASGDVHYDTLSLSFLPWPRAEMRGVTLDIPAAISGRIPLLEVALATLPLLSGDVRVTSIRATDPALVVQLPTGTGGDPLAAYRAGAGPIVAALTRALPDATLAIAGGRVDLVTAGQPVVRLAELAATATMSAAAIDLEASCAGERWRALQVRLNIASGSLATSLQLTATGVDATALYAMLPAPGAAALRGGAVDARVEATTDAQHAVRGHLTASTPKLVIARGGRALDVGAARVAIAAARDGEQLTMALEALQLGEVLPAATGSLSVRLDGGAPALDLQVPSIDVARLHSALETLAGDVERVRTLAAALPTGTASGLTLAAAAADVRGLTQARALRVEARLDAATVRIPSLDITATDVAGRVVLAAGELTATQLAGRLGNGAVRDATLGVTLAPGVSLQHLEAGIDVDLAQALPVARRILGPGAHPVLADVEALTGRAAGTVVYDRRGGRPRYTFDVTSIAGHARDRRLPFPLDVQAGALRYTDDHFAVRRLSGRFGNTQVTDASAEIATGAKPRLLAATGDLVVDLGEIYPWLASLPAARAALRGVERATGTAAVHVARLAGSLSDSQALDFDVALVPTRLRIVASGLPGALMLDGGSAALTPPRVSLDRVRASLLDGSVTATGSVDEYTSAAPRVALALTDAAMGIQAIEWARAHLRLPLRAVPRDPVRTASGQLTVAGAGRGPWSVQGALVLAGEARAELDLEWRDESLDLRRFALRDAWSDATVSFRRSGRSADFAFSGNVDNRTFQRILLHPPTIEGAARGDLRATIDLDDPRRTTATGTLDAQGIDLAERWGLPATIERVHLVATGDAARVSDTVVVVGAQRLELAGTIARRQAGYAVDAQVSVGDLDPARLAAALRPADSPSAWPGAASGWKLPVEGKVALVATSVAVGGQVVRSVAATASLFPDRVVADVTDARVCDIALPFTAVITPNHVAIDGRVQVRAQPLAPTLSCAAGVPIEVSGTFDLDATFTASGPQQDLRDALRGTFQMTGSVGRIRRLPVVDHILSVDAVAERAHPEVFADEPSSQPDSRIAVAGTLEGSQARIDRATLDKPFLGIAMSGEADLALRTVNLAGLVAPLTPANQALRNVPIVGRLFGPTIIGIPIRVTGNLQDPTVTLIGAGAVGRGVVDLMAATLQAPIELLDPLLGGRRRGP